MQYETDNVNISMTTTSLNHNTLELTLIGLSMTSGSLLTVLGNVLVFVIYFKTKSMQAPKNLFVLSLAVADVIIAVISMNLYTVSMICGHWPFGIVTCNLWLVIDHWACTVSTYTLLAIAVDRYYAVFQPISHRLLLSKYYVKKVIFSIWLCGFFLWGPIILIYPYITGDMLPNEVCYVKFLIEDQQPSLVLAFFSYFGPALIIAILYICISVKLVKQCEVLQQTFNRIIEENKGDCACAISSPSSQKDDTSPDKILTPDHSAIPMKNECSDNKNSLIKSTKSSTNLSIPFTMVKESKISFDNQGFEVSCKTTNRLSKDAQHTVGKCQTKYRGKKFEKHLPIVARRKTLKAHRRGVKMLAFVLLAFGLAWLPYYLSIVIVCCTNIRLPEVLWRFCYIIGWFNSLLNPFCYAFGYPEYKKAIRKIFSKFQDFIVSNDK